MDIKIILAAFAVNVTLCAINVATQRYGLAAISAFAALLMLAVIARGQS